MAEENLFEKKIKNMWTHVIANKAKNIGIKTVY